jgi:hypothetical protein
LVLTFTLLKVYVWCRWAGTYLAIKCLLNQGIKTYLRSIKGLKYVALTANNDTYAYVRSIPKALLNHPSFNGRKNYRKQLGQKSVSNDQLFQSWKQAHEDFEQYIDNLKQINIDVIDRNALIKRAESYLRANNLNAGMLSNDESLTKQDNQQQQYELKQMIDHSGIFEELFEHATKR